MSRTKSQSPAERGDGVLFAERANEFDLYGRLRSDELWRHSESEPDKGVYGRMNKTRSRTSYI